MMKKERYTESASPDQERMLKYKLFATAFSYPDEEFFKFFPYLLRKRESLIADYDRLFRAQEIWLYSTEYLANHEFQKSRYLSDIMGFYRAFGLEPSGDRADSLSNAFEFMHYLVFKTMRTRDKGDGQDSIIKERICDDAQRKFFETYLAPSAKKIAESILHKSADGFYRNISHEMLEFLKEEMNFLGGKR